MLINPQDYNHECFIVGGGPSLRDFDWSLLENKFVIGINNVYKALPSCNICYFTDNPWWRDHRDQLMKHKCKKIKGSLQGGFVLHPEVEEYLLTGPYGVDKKPKQLKHGNNSPYAAINLAGWHLGFKTIYLLGIDMRWGTKGDKTTSHWHKDHKRVDPENAYNKMAENYNHLITPLKEDGITVINLNPDSGLKAFPKVDPMSILKPKTKEQLLGDQVEKALEKVGAKHIANVYQRITKKPCNCGLRKQYLNNLHRKIIKK